MKSPLSVGTPRVPILPARSSWPKGATIRRAAGLAVAVAVVAGAGTASALFVDYLAERAEMRRAAAETVRTAKSQETAALAGPDAPIADPIALDDKTVSETAADLVEAAATLSHEDPGEVARQDGPGRSGPASGLSRPWQTPLAAFAITKAKALAAGTAASTPAGIGCSP